MCFAFQEMKVHLHCTGLLHSHMTSSGWTCSLQRVRLWADLARPLSAFRRQLVVAEDEGVGRRHAHQRRHHEALQQHNLVKEAVP